MLPPQQIVSLLKLDGLVEQLEKKNDFEERVQMTLQAIQDTLPLDIKCDQKDNAEALNLRKKADKLVFRQRGKFTALLKAREIYSKSIAKATDLSAELAKAYANRSSVLFHLKFHNECIHDIDRALQLSSYPDHLRANLTRRKAKCLKLMGNPESEKICDEARSLLESLSLNDEKKEWLELKIDRVADITSIHEHESQDIQLKKESTFRFIPNKSIPSASDAIYIEYNKNFGKHLVADRDIEAGEVVIVEKPYASVLSPKYLYTHCSHCFIRTWDSIPCENCVYAMYCSKTCKNEAWKQYHDIECPLRGYFESLSIQDVGVFSLKLVILAVRESGSFKNLKTELKNVDECNDYIKKCLTNDGIYQSDKYKALYSLEGHANIRNKQEIIAISLNTAFILYYLFTLTSFFGENSNKTILSLCKNKNAMFIGKLLTHHFFMISINDHEFVECRDNKFHRIGSIIGPVASLMNHSCNSNVTRCSVLKNQMIQQVVFANCPIKKGSQILDDYGCHFTCNPKTEREAFLKKYYFKCTCTACVENWPIFEDLPAVLTFVTEKEAKVDVARAVIRSKEYRRILFQVGLEKYPASKTDILVGLAKSMTILSANTDKPNKEYYEILELFRHGFNAIFGNNFEVHSPMCIC